MPEERDVPHWARQVVEHHRRELELPERVTDRMIYARLVETQGLSPERERARLLSLAAETAP